MPYLRLNGTRLYYEDTGGRGRPIIVFSHGLLWDTRLYEAQVARFSDQYRCISYDHRGQGRSAGHEAASVPMELLYEDAVGLIEALCDGPCHFVGLSMGGFVGLRVAARKAALIRSLVLLSTQAGPEDAGKIRRYGALSWVARAGGAPLLAPQIMSILFGRAFLRDPSRAQERAIYQRRLEALPRPIHRAVRGVIERAEISRELGKISAPALALHGDQDAAIPLARAREMVSLIRGARLEVLPEVGHSPTLEAPHLVNRAMGDFWGSLS